MDRKLGAFHPDRAVTRLLDGAFCPWCGRRIVNPSDHMRQTSGCRGDGAGRPRPSD